MINGRGAVCQWLEQCEMLRHAGDAYLPWWVTSLLSDNENQGHYDRKRMAPGPIGNRAKAQVSGLAMRIEIG